MKQTTFDSVVILSPFHWNFRDDMAGTTHHIAREFSRLCPTLLVEPAVQWNPRAEHFRPHRLAHSLFGARTQSPQENLIVFRRRGLPFGRLGLVRDFDLRRNSRALRKFLSECGFRRTLLWHSFPYWSEPLMEAVDHGIFAYHCLDYTTREEEISLVRRADAVFCVSETLVAKQSQLNPRTFHLPNGVDIGLFDAARTALAPRPADLPRNGRLLGFLGHLNCRLDAKLLLEIAQAFPDAYLVLIGRIPTSDIAPRESQRQALETLRSMPNVRFLGFKPTALLPRYLLSFDVCLMPFLAERFNAECDPLKFYEYAALGKPIVSTPTAVARRHGDLCCVAESPQEFIHRISEALHEPNSPELRERRIQMAMSYSWESIVARACEVLNHSDAPSRVGLSTSYV